MVKHEEVIYAYGKHPMEVHVPLNVPVGMFGLSPKWEKERRANEGVEPS